MEEQTAGAVAVPEEKTETKQKPKDKKRPKRQPRYNVVLWDSDDHSYFYVIKMLSELFHYPYETGYQLAREVDSYGRAVVLTTTLEHAELKRDQIHAYGKDILIERCKGSMRATIEPVPGDDD